MSEAETIKADRIGNKIMAVLNAEDDLATDLAIALVMNVGASLMDRAGVVECTVAGQDKFGDRNMLIKLRLDYDE